jgi:hypothetical protein
MSFFPCALVSDPDPVERLSLRRCLRLLRHRPLGLSSFRGLNEREKSTSYHVPPAPHLRRTDKTDHESRTTSPWTICSWSTPCLVGWLETLGSSACRFCESCFDKIRFKRLLPNRGPKPGLDRCSLLFVTCEKYHASRESWVRA